MALPIVKLRLKSVLITFYIDIHPDFTISSFIKYFISGLNCDTQQISHVIFAYLILFTCVLVNHFCESPFVNIKYISPYMIMSTLLLAVEFQSEEE